MKVYQVTFNMPFVYEVVAENEKEAEEKASDYLEIDTAKGEGFVAPHTEVEEINVPVCEECEERAEECKCK